MTSPSLSTTAVPVGAVIVSGIVAQLADDAAFFLLPPLGVVGWLSGVIAILLTAGAARFVTRGGIGSAALRLRGDEHVGAVARTGLAIGLTSAVIGLLVGGLGIVAILLAGITVVAGVAGAVAGRRVDVAG